MNDGRQMGLHYVDAGFPYAVNENFVDFFQGFSHVPVNYAFAGSMPDQESVYWSMNMNPYKFGLSGPGSTSYYSSYEVNGHLPRMEIDRTEWEYSSTITAVEPATTDSPPRRDGVSSMQTIPEECSPNHLESNSSSQVIWQDNIDPDNMTYEELLDLGEAVGTQSRGLSQELIDMLPTSKYKFGSLFKRKNSGKRIADHCNADVVVDSYHRYKVDVAMMKDIGFNAYRFSISWPRILPHGNLQGGVNREGIAYYNNLINDLIANGQQPFITLFHSDFPQALEDEYGGFLNRKIVQDFADYAEVCFREFGDRVKHWITLNEPVLYSTLGYGNGGSPPNRCSKWLANCTAGDSTTEPYVVTHHLILSHAAAVKVYREKFQVSQKGQIGVTLNSAWVLPLSQSKEDIEAAYRGLAFMYDWFMEPLYSGTYPAIMVKNVGGRLPKFTRSEYLMVKGSFDFIGLNYYTSTYATSTPCPRERPTAFTDACVTLTSRRNGVLIGPKAASDWLYVYPPGIQGLLEYTKKKFNNPVIYITENGIDEVNDGKMVLNDRTRIDYFSHHLLYLHRAIRNGVRVKGYFAWSLLDNFEWTAGYSLRFGLVYVDYKNGLRRYRKRSALWFKIFLHQ